MAAEVLETYRYIQQVLQFRADGGVPLRFRKKEYESSATRTQKLATQSTRLHPGCINSVDGRVGYIVCERAFYFPIFVKQSAEIQYITLLFQDTHRLFCHAYHGTEVIPSPGNIFYFFRRDIGGIAGESCKKEQQVIVKK